MTILNLGCGNRIITDKDAINHDRWQHRPEVNAVHDLNELPWPWLDNSYDEIQLISVAEHLRIDLVEQLNECWRILKPGGMLVIKYPLWSTPTAHDDPTHRWYWSEKVLDVFDPDTKYGKDAPYYTQRKWHIDSVGVIKERNVKAIMRPKK